ncbi:MAG: hypothetical protein V4760_13020 [Bdellovibrionota bacterium]
MNKFRITMNKFNATAFAMLVMFSSVGCGKLEFTQNPLEEIKIPKILKPTAQGVEIVSGASIGQRTVLNGYQVDASVGAMRDKLETVTPNGYTIYHGVKGSIVSDETTSQ